MKTFLICLVLLVDLVTLSIQTQAQEKIVHAYPTVPSVLNIDPNITDNTIAAEGLLSSGDNGGGMLRYYPQSTTATNAATVFKPFNFGGRWQMIFGGPGTNSGGGGGLWLTTNSGPWGSNPVGTLLPTVDGEDIQLVRTLNDGSGFSSGVLANLESDIGWSGGFSAALAGYNNAATITPATTVINGGGGAYGLDATTQWFLGHISPTPTEASAVQGFSQGDYTFQVGVSGIAAGSRSGQTNVGVSGLAYNLPGVNGVAGAFFTAPSGGFASTTITPSVLMADNTSTGLPIFIGRTNNDPSSVVFQIPADGSIAAGTTNQWKTGQAATSITVTGSVTNAVVATINGRKVYLLIANETPP